MLDGIRRTEVLQYVINNVVEPSLFMNHDALELKCTETARGYAGWVDNNNNISQRVVDECILPICTIVLINRH
jgi:hypothetical protein